MSALPLRLAPRALAALLLLSCGTGPTGGSLDGSGGQGGLNGDRAGDDGSAGIGGSNGCTSADLLATYELERSGWSLWGFGRLGSAVKEGTTERAVVGSVIGELMVLELESGTEQLFGWPSTFPEVVQEGDEVTASMQHGWSIINGPNYSLAVRVDFLDSPPSRIETDDYPPVEYTLLCEGREMLSSDCDGGSMKKSLFGLVLGNEVLAPSGDVVADATGWNVDFLGGIYAFPVFHEMCMEHPYFLGVVAAWRQSETRT